MKTVMAVSPAELFRVNIATITEMLTTLCFDCKGEGAVTYGRSMTIMHMSSGDRVVDSGEEDGRIWAVAASAIPPSRTLDNDAGEGWMVRYFDMHPEPCPSCGGSGVSLPSSESLCMAICSSAIVEGVPLWLESDDQDMREYGVEYFRLVREFLMGAGAKFIEENKNFASDMQSLALARAAQRIANPDLPFEPVGVLVPRPSSRPEQEATQAAGALSEDELAALLGDDGDSAEGG